MEWVEDPIVESQTLEIAPVDVSEEPAPILQATPIAENVPMPVVLQAPAVESIPSPVREYGVSRLYWLLAALLLVAILLGGWALRNSAAAASNQTPEMRLEIMTSSTTDPTSLAISPDGLKVVFVAISEGRSQLRLRSLESGIERSLPGTDGALFPFWSPNNRSIGFFADGLLEEDRH